MHQSSHFSRTQFGATSPYRAAIRAAILTLFVLLTSRPAVRADDEQPKKKPETSASSDAAPKPESKSGIVLIGRLSRAAAMTGEPVLFSLVVENDSDAPLKNIAIEHLQTTGFKLVRRCWSGDATAKECLTVDGVAPAMAASCNPSGDKLCDELPPHQSLTVWGDLLPETSEPSQQAFAVIRWSTNGFDSRGIAQLGPLESQGCLRGLWLLVTQDWDFGIPFWLTVFGGLFALWQNHRDKEEHAKAERRAKTEREEAAKREVYQKTWDLMLPQANRMSLGYYIPMATATLTATFFLQECRAAKQPSNRQMLAGFFAIAQMQWHRLRIKRTYGGYLFKSRTAESLVELLFQQHRTYFDMNIDRYVVLTKFLKNFHSKYELVDFEADSIGWDPSQQQFWQDFKQWAIGPECEADLIALSAMQKLMTYEANRPFLNWYKEQIPVKLTPDERTLVTSLPTGQLLDESATADRVRAYLDEIASGRKFEMVIQ